jgi:hypothetical protein
MSVGDDSRSQIVNESTGAAEALPLVSRVSCPHCWEQYPPEESMWISSDHPTLAGDPKLGSEEPRRFKAERFNVQGIALDGREERAAGLACPNCHLEVPRVLYEYRPFFVSIVGAPGSGKSFFLPAMTWFLRSQMPEKFAVNFQDADPRLNIRLHQYEETLFLNADREKVVTLEKTEVQGMENLYDSVTIGGDVVAFPRPFVFRMEPTPDHPGRSKVSTVARAVCMYDNAGESFAAAASGRESRLTNHLEHCDLTLFLFDPTQHPRFRERAKAVSKDPQWNHTRPNAVLQNTILDNAAARLRNLRGLSLQERFNGPLVVVVTKLDAWANLIPEDVRNPLLAADYTPRSTVDSRACVLRADLVQQLSKTIRGLLRTLAPEIVAAADGFSTDVTYIPVSATGCVVRPMENAAANGIADARKIGGVAEGPRVAFGVRPRNMSPKWCELPLLYGLSQAKVPLLRTAAAKPAGGV